ncbi:hypothetical protein [Novosphingobium sp. B 225]|uniref:hypothetical protein n=1 Tax=Novosphingobium sp. B 225 TaxID=1961849 RepID=UPI001124E9DB|nr:hypothetical protein [Novosphingobium sp. B 225]
MGSRAAAALLLLTAACAPSPLASFRSTLAAQDSATAALGQWCAMRHLADPAEITAAPVLGGERVVPAEIPALLALPKGSALGYRHVRLSCGGKVLSQAHNWYARARLTPEMNTTLDTTSTPFGKAVAALRFTRQRLGEARGAAYGCPAGTALSHRARLVLPDGAPLAVVVECYTRANLE